MGRPTHYLREKHWGRGCCSRSLDGGCTRPFRAPGKGVCRASAYVVLIVLLLRTLGAIHSSKSPTGPTGKSGPPQKVDQFFRNFSAWTEPIHRVLDGNFRKFWLNGSRPLTSLQGKMLLLHFLLGSIYSYYVPQSTLSAIKCSSYGSWNFRMCIYCIKRTLACLQPSPPLRKKSEKGGFCTQASRSVIAYS